MKNLFLTSKASFMFVVNTLNTIDGFKIFKNSFACVLPEILCVYINFL